MKKIAVSNSQASNSILSYFTLVEWKYDTMDLDFRIGQHTFVHFVSLSYSAAQNCYVSQHNCSFFSPDWAETDHKILLCYVDIEEEIHLEEINKVCCQIGASLICGCTLAELARYLETIAHYDIDDIFYSDENLDWYNLTKEIFTSIRGVTKQDVICLCSSTDSLRSLFTLSEQQTKIIPGFGVSKGKSLNAIFWIPFLERSIRCSKYR